MDSAPPKIPNLTSHPSIAPTSKKLELVVSSGWSTWYTWYTCTGTHGTPEDGLDGFSRPKKTQFDPSHPSVAPTSQKLESGGVAVGGAPGTRGTRVQGHVGQCGTPGDGLDGFSTPKNPHFDPSHRL